MSENDSNSESSYDSDDSEYNYIPGYVDIDNIEVEDEANLEEQASQPDPDTYQPYEDELIATEEWLSEYHKMKETQVEFERKLQDHFDGNILINSWWVQRVCVLCSCCFLQIAIAGDTAVSSKSANVVYVVPKTYGTQTNFSVVRK